jgi:hypothetical protein
MKKNIITTCLLASALIAGICANAQQKVTATPEQRANKVTDWMKANLQLDESQVSQVKDINLKYANKTQEVKDNTTLTRRQKLQVLQDNDKAKDKELKNVLTEDQYKTYQSKKAEIKKQVKQKMKENKKGG